MILENQDASQGSKEGPTQGFNLLQISPNWFLGIWTLEPPMESGPKYPHPCVLVPTFGSTNSTCDVNQWWENTIVI